MARPQSRAQECWFEARSCQFAWSRFHAIQAPIDDSKTQESKHASHPTKVGILPKEPGHHAALGAVLGVGSGSTQFSSYFQPEQHEGAVHDSNGTCFVGGDAGRTDCGLGDLLDLTPFVLPVGNGLGRACLTKRRSETGTENALAAAHREWHAICVKKVETWITDECLFNHKAWSKKGLSLSHPVLCISGAYYGAVAAGLALPNVKHPTDAIPAGHAIKKFRHRLEEILNDPALKSGLQSNPSETPAQVKAKKIAASNVSNLTYLSVMFHRLFDDDTPVCFARDWELPLGAPGQSREAAQQEGAPFRTTCESCPVHNARSDDNRPPHNNRDIGLLLGLCPSPGLHCLTE